MIVWVPHKGLRNTGHQDCDNILALEMFTPEGLLYPRLALSVSITSVPGPRGYRVSCHMKARSEGWWREAPIPRALLPNLHQMLEDVIVDLANA